MAIEVKSCKTHEVRVSCAYYDGDVTFEMVVLVTVTHVGGWHGGTMLYTMTAFDDEVGADTTPHAWSFTRTRTQGLVDADEMDGMIREHVANWAYSYDNSQLEWQRFKRSARVVDDGGLFDSLDGDDAD